MSYMEQTRPPQGWVRHAIAQGFRFENLKILVKHIYAVRRPMILEKVHFAKKESTELSIERSNGRRASLHDDSRDY